MNSVYVRKLLEAQDTTNFSIKLDKNVLNKIKSVIDDKFYFDFLINIKNGGLFFERSLQLYSFTLPNDSCNIEYVNSILAEEYGSLCQNLWVFGQEIFGNQFAFDLASQKIIFFNCESGEREVLANNFKEWLDVLFNDFEYLTGMPYAVAWKEKYDLLLPNQRLVPIKPFVIGGEYAVNNFSAVDFPEYFSYNAHIAKQIFNLKDGTNVKLVIKPRK